MLEIQDQQLFALVTTRMKTFQIVFFLVIAYMYRSFEKHFLIKTADVKNGKYMDGLDIENADPDDKKSKHFLKNLKERDEREKNKDYTWNDWDWR